MVAPAPALQSGVVGISPSAHDAGAGFRAPWESLGFSCQPDWAEPWLLGPREATPGSMSGSRREEGVPAACPHRPGAWSPRFMPWPASPVPLPP